MPDATTNLEGLIKDSFYKMYPCTTYLQKHCRLDSMQEEYQHIRIIKLCFMLKFDWLNILNKTNENCTTSSNANKIWIECYNFNVNPISKWMFESISTCITHNILFIFPPFHRNETFFVMNKQIWLRYKQIEYLCQFSFNLYIFYSFMKRGYKFMEQIYKGGISSKTSRYSQQVHYG